MFGGCVILSRVRVCLRLDPHGSGSIIIPALVADHFSTRGEVAKFAEEARALGSDYGDQKYGGTSGRRGDPIQRWKVGGPLSGLYAPLWTWQAWPIVHGSAEKPRHTAPLLNRGELQIPLVYLIIFVVLTGVFHTNFC